ncbi:hypothetical protein SAMN05216548_114129 [Faunimonas pinastri]|uniref:Uncharacterized protein n=1 Tax=Faunimonas pinastri TaxID=1855383 RepID=A0A1H9N080_9HYPH|nr:hypothetical protein SAMN05216548_114129 [Faunimonas pinastri]
MLDALMATLLAAIIGGSAIGTLLWAYLRRRRGDYFLRNPDDWGVN